MFRAAGFYFVVSLITFTSTVDADVRLPGWFGDHMVFQRQQPVAVWGWADAGEQVTVQLGSNSQSTTAGTDGTWQVELDPLDAGGPHELVVSGNNKLTISDVLIGEVWLCSGQSNMAWPVSKADNFEQEKQLANLPRIRMVTIAKNAQPELQSDVAGQWKIASAETVGSFSATAWFFGRKLHQELDVPIGLINSSWGGTDIAAWTSGEAQQQEDALAPLIQKFDAQVGSFDEAEADYQQRLKRWQDRKAAGQEVGKAPRKPQNPMVNQNRPTNLFNGMIHPLVPFGIRGAIWYQGERNSKTLEAGLLYETQLKTLITDWRQQFGQGDFPFLTVQLPNFHAPQSQPVENTGWVAVREGQLNSLRLENTGIAITTDIGLANDIHPPNKQDVGLRLALWALGTTYEKQVVYSGPLFSSFQSTGYNSDEDINGNIQVYFSHTGHGLSTSDDEKLVRGFAIAGEDQVFHEVTGRINGSMIQLTHPEVRNPVAVRYNWADNPKGNLVNSAGLPAAPFRSDRWELK